MLSIASLLFVLSLFGVDPVSTDEEVNSDAKWRPVLDKVAEEHVLVVDPDATELDLVKKPVFVWTRPQSGDVGGTYGTVYVWTNRGNAEAVACFWRTPAGAGEYSLYHEMHSLSPTALHSERRGPNRWKAKAGLKRTLLPGAPTPSETAAGRLLQMRTFSRDFAGHSISSRDVRTELRLLPQPLYRYQSTNPDVLDGALFGFVCTVGTDPEVFLQLEALQTETGPKWHYTLARFSHQNLHVNYQDREIWRAIRDAANPVFCNSDQTYWMFREPFDSAKLNAKKESAPASSPGK